MKSIARACVVTGMLLALAGCGGGGGSSVTGPGGGGGVSEAEPNDFTGQVVGTLSATDIAVNGRTASATDVDLYRVVLSGTTNLLVTLDWTGANDLELSISNSAGIFVRTVDTASHPETCTLASLPAGTYTIRVGSFSNSGTNYSLTLGSR
ncbi:MAG: PPC domain-containing protein [Candidatus Eisenbacteria bacterium]|nr:PPC domain-containing protein [Candidatus Eisenbacteria bacterium]